MAEFSSLGFQVRARDIDMASSGSNVDDRISSLSGNSEGFRSAYDTPVTEQRKHEQFDEYRPHSVVSRDSISFHTPEPYNMSSQDEGEDEEEVDINVEIPDIEAPSSRRYLPDQPKLDLAEDAMEGRAEKAPLVDEYRDQNHREHHPRHGSNERSLLLNSDNEKTRCCVLC